MNEKKMCPRCGGFYDGLDTRSRVDDSTAVCKPCGDDEAVVHARGFERHIKRLVMLGYTEDKAIEEIHAKRFYANSFGLRLAVGEVQS